MYHLLDNLGEVGGGVAITESGDILCVDIHIIIYSRARGGLDGFRGVIVEVLLHRLTVAFSSAIFIDFYGRTTLGGMDVRSKGLWTYGVRG